MSTDRRFAVCRRVSRPAAKQTGHAPGASRTCVEALERRWLLSASLVQDINPGTGSSRGDPYVENFTVDWMPKAQVAVGNTVYFIATDTNGHAQLWKTTAGGSGATKIVDFGATPGGYLTAVNGVLYFAGAGVGTGSLSYWRSDGTAAGTVMIGTSRGPVSDYQWWDDDAAIIVANGTVFFQGGDAAHGRELWRVDDSSAGASMVLDISPGSSDGVGFLQPAVLGDTLIFAASDPVHGGELWRSDGTAAGTWLLKDIVPGASGSFPGNLTAFNGEVYFNASNQLWKTDGTPEGTVLVQTIGDSSSSTTMWPRRLTVVNDTLYFTAGDATTGVELWKSDGTTAGTVPVGDLNPGASGSSPNMLTPFNGKLVFSVDASPSGPGLWITDGTPGGTVPLKGLSRPRTPKTTWTPRGIVVGGTMYFPASATPNGDLELWQTDGTPAGTVETQDINPNGSSKPGEFYLAGDTLYFGADDGQTGRELWKLPVSALPTVTTATVGADSAGTEVRITFSKDVATSITPDDLTLANRATPGTVFHASAATYDPNTFTATFTFTDPGGGPLADADYLATLAGAGVYDAANNHLDGDANGVPGGDWTYAFSQLTGLTPAADAAYYLAGPPNNKVLTVTAGTVTLTRDLSIGYPGVSLNVSGNASVYFAVDQNFANVSLSGNGTISVGQPPQSSGAGIVAGTPVPTPTPTPTPAPVPSSGPVVLTKQNAAFVRDGAYANTDFASDASLVVKKGPAGYTRETYLTFDLSRVGAIHSAKLRLFGHLNQSAPKGVTVRVYAAGGALPGRRLTWHNRPTAVGSASPSTTVAGTGGRWYEWDVGQLLRAARAAGARSVTLALKGAAATDAAALFDGGRTGANGPRLILA
jgi:ELWxxDGT repeat protein